MYYINIKLGGVTETVDEFETHLEALAMLREYQLMDRRYYLSTRATIEWLERP